MAVNYIDNNKYFLVLISIYKYKLTVCEPSMYEHNWELNSCNVKKRKLSSTSIGFDPNTQHLRRKYSQYWLKWGQYHIKKEKLNHILICS